MIAMYCEVCQLQLGKRRSIGTTHSKHDGRNSATFTQHGHSYVG